MGIKPPKIIQSKGPNCMACQYLQVTWKPDKPYECRAFGFQSKRMPSLEVKLASGEQCLRFDAKCR